MAKKPTMTAAITSGGRSASMTAMPIISAEAAMPYSMPGIGTPATPSAPPSAMTSGKVTGRSQIAGGPRKAPQSPTATIAAT